MSLSAYSFAMFCLLTDRIISKKNFSTSTCMIVFTFPEAVPPATPITKGLGTLSLSNPFFLCQLLVDPDLFAAAIIWKFEFVAKYLQHFNIFWRSIITNSLRLSSKKHEVMKKTHDAMKKDLKLAPTWFCCFYPSPKVQDKSYIKLVAFVWNMHSYVVFTNFLW